jgi:hypothetical protein
MDVVMRNFWTGLAFFVVSLAYASLVGAQQADWETPPKQQNKEPEKVVGTPEEIARLFLQQTSINRNIVYILLHSAHTSPIVRSLYPKFGKDEVNKVVQQMVQPVVQKNYPAWEEHLIASYLEVFRPEELYSLAKRRTASPYFDVFRAKSGQVGPRMQERTKALLNAASRETIEAVANHFK